VVITDRGEEHNDRDAVIGRVAAKVTMVVTVSTAKAPRRMAHRLLSSHDAIGEGTEPEPRALCRRPVKSRCDSTWVAQARADVEPRVDADRDRGLR
jgi:hypothetical protein